MALIKRKGSALFFFIVFSTVLILSGCKKGEDDPVFSLKSRTKRLEGDWKLKEGKVQVEFFDNSAYVNRTYEYTSTGYKINVGGTGTFEGQHKLELAFSEDGIFELNEQADSISFTCKGRWDFMQKGGDYKNKERIVVRLDRGTGSSGYYAFFNKSMTTFTYAIRELRKHRLVLEVVDDLVEVDGKGYKAHSNAFYVFER